MLIACLTPLVFAVVCDQARAGGGLLTITTEDEATKSPIISHLDLDRADGRPQILRKVVHAGNGWVVNETIELGLPDGPYRFRLTRGPEYRVVQGDFTLERTSQDSRVVALPRMVDMKSEGWLAGDMAMPPNMEEPRLRMHAAGLHFVAPVGGRLGRETRSLLPNDTSPYQPTWIAAAATPIADGDILFYSGGGAAIDRTEGVLETAAASIVRLASDESVKVAIANPSAWLLPVWIGTEQVDGVFVLSSDWASNGQTIQAKTSGRPSKDAWFRGPQGPGRAAERLYWNLLDVGLWVAPLAGTSADEAAGKRCEIGYNRVYATSGVSLEDETEDEIARAPISSANQYLDAVWQGHTMFTNGPMLRVELEGQPPGHVFSAYAGDELDLGFDVKLSVRDPVDYLEVIHNGRVAYQAKLDEFAAAGGQLPRLNVVESGWALVRVVTEHEDHLRMASTAAWHFDFDNRRRISREAVKFFGDWLGDCEQELKKLPPELLAPHVPDVVRARSYWRDKYDAANAP